MPTINYVASPTGARFHTSNKVVRGFLGPVGNGKSVCCINEMHRLAVLQEPNCDGIRKTKWVIVRNTHEQLETTTFQTFVQWIPPEVCSTTVKPMRGNMQYPLADGSRVEAKFIFLALDRPDDVRKLLSLEVTGVFMNEARELPYAVVKGARERIGRYPSQIDGYTDVYQNGKLIYDAPKQLDSEGKVMLEKDGTPSYKPCTRKALLMDTNPPEDDHWWYQLAEEGCLRTNKSAEAKRAVAGIFDFVRGPAPFLKDGNEYINNPLAENIKFLPNGYKYYRDMLAGNSEDHINVMIMGNYGTIKDGKPVYPQYNDRLHCPEKPLGIIEDLPIGLGWDGGLTPTCIIGQQTARGQLRVIAELVSEDMGVRQFARDVVKPFLQKNFYGIKVAFSYIDPAGKGRGEAEAKSAMGILNDDYVDYDINGDIIGNEDGDIIKPLNMGFETEPAPTNDPTKRIDAVNSYLIKLVDGEPGYLVSRKCPMIRKGKIGGYQYKRMQVSGEEKFKDKPSKNKFSHPADAEQYMALGFAGGYVVDSHDDYDDDYDNFNIDDVNVMGY
jgi:hypothetical protein